MVEKCTSRDKVLSSLSTLNQQTQVREGVIKNGFLGDMSPKAPPPSNPLWDKSQLFSPFLKIFL